MIDFDTYAWLREHNARATEYDIEDQITFDDLFEELKMRSTF